ncbi:MAG: hypothetical protein MHM6MM_002632 [Cercozoa sp. M6MM]
METPARVADLPRILAYNLFGLPRVAAAFARMDFCAVERARILASEQSDALFENVEVVCFAECFRDDVFPVLREGMARRGFVHHSQRVGHNLVTVPTGRKRRLGWPLNGGVVIFSRIAIGETNEVVFRSAVGEDWCVAKGAVHVRLQTRPTVHIVATHLQANSTAQMARPSEWFIGGASRRERRLQRCKDVRAAQLQQVRDLVERLSVDESDLVFFAGDFNIHWQTDECARSLCGVLGAATPAEQVPFDNPDIPSCDHGKNSILLAQKSDPPPPDAAEESSTLDYVLPTKESLKKLASMGVRWRMRTISRVAAPEAGILAREAFRYKGRQFDDLSDHYPVLGYAVQMRGDASGDLQLTESSANEPSENVNGTGMSQSETASDGEPEFPPISSSGLL